MALDEAPGWASVVSRVAGLLEATGTIPSLERRSTTWNAGFSSPSCCRSPCCTAIRRSSCPPQKPAIDVVEKKDPAPLPTPTPEARSARRARTGATAEPAAQITEPSEREIVVETATTQVVLTNRGGRILHWRLKDYRDSAGSLVDLVPSGVPPDQPKPFALVVDDPALTRRLNSALFRVTRGCRTAASTR